MDEFFECRTAFILIKQAADRPSDIRSGGQNGIKTGSRTSPGGFGDRRDMYSPNWWTLSGSYALC